MRSQKSWDRPVLAALALGLLVHSGLIYEFYCPKRSESEPADTYGGDLGLTELGYTNATLAESDAALLEWARRADQPVAGPRPGESGGEVRKSDKLRSWLGKLQVTSKPELEIPNLPLDGQPDPERVTHIDADLRGCLGQVREQLNCRSCYAFSWNALAEWHYCRQTGNKIDFSEQHLIDCGSSHRLKGCLKGGFKQVRSFTDDNGFYLESEYPYKGKPGSCRGAKGTIEVVTREFTRIKVDRAEWERVLEEQPILVSTRLPDDIKRYQGGVHPGDNCHEDYKHGMLLVGHGRQNGQPYWLLRNSSGASWGEQGYLRLTRDLPDMGKCFATAFISRFKFKALDDELYHQFEPQFEPSVQAEPVKIRQRLDAGAAKPFTNWLHRQALTGSGARQARGRRPNLSHMGPVGSR